MAKTKRKSDDKKPKKKPRAVELDDEKDDDDGGADEGFAPPRKVSRNDAYTGMLLISLVCLVAATVLLLLDSNDMTATGLQNPAVKVPALVTPPAAPAL